MSVICQPTGMAREYSPTPSISISDAAIAANTAMPWHLAAVAGVLFWQARAAKGYFKLLEKDLKREVYTEQILISFIGVVYCDSVDDGATTRVALEMLSAYHVPVAVLSKGGK